MRRRLGTFGMCIVALGLPLGCRSFDVAEDPATDAGATDAGATDASDAAPASGCRAYPAAAFCDDFDTGSWSSKWTALHDKGSSIVEVTNQGASPPNALSARMVGTSPAGPYLYAMLAGASDAKVARFEMAIAFDALDTQGAAQAGYAAIGPQGAIDNVRHLRIETNQQGLALVDLPTSTVLMVVRIPKPAAWTRAAIVIDYRGATPTAQLVIDDKAVADPKAISGFPVLEKPMLAVGIPFSGAVTPNAEWRVRFDDVRWTVER